LEELAAAAGMAAVVRHHHLLLAEAADLVGFIMPQITKIGHQQSGQQKVINGYLIVHIIYLMGLL